ncbi:hypothetical protein [Gordonia sp. KTR9]|uniref:hypothetical protein n=1 Tax=Gordonia sp. KTR9 TaxID=337191 RepID=UPI0003102AB0|nr:hypothetical protein [Gordonia sp. KTR9]
MDFDQLPIEWQEKIRALRADSARYRIERNKLRQELDALRERVGFDHQFLLMMQDTGITAEQYKDFRAERDAVRAWSSGLADDGWGARERV